MSRTIQVCAGIGDNIWLIQKLINSGEQFHFQLPLTEPLRGKQIFDLLPQVTASCTYVKGLYYRKLNRGSVHRMFPYWKTINARKIRMMMLSCNEWLEEGNRIEGFLADLPTSYTLDYVTSDTDKEIAMATTPLGEGYIGIYCSAYSTQRAWGFWDEHGWFELIQKLKKQYPDKTYIIIGAEWDMDLGSKLIEKLKAAKISHRSTIGQPLGVVVEILKRLDYFIGFPSGLSILNETLGKNGLMFYPPHLSKMINAWANPDRIASGDYKGMLFCSPDEAFQWIKQNKKI